MRRGSNYREGSNDELGLDGWDPAAWLGVPCGWVELEVRYGIDDFIMNLVLRFSVRKGSLAGARCRRPVVACSLEVGLMAHRNRPHTNGGRASSSRTCEFVNTSVVRLQVGEHV